MTSNAEDEDDNSMAMGESASKYGQKGSPAFRGFTAATNDFQPVNTPALFQTSQNKRAKFQEAKRKQSQSPRISRLPRRGQPSLIPDITKNLLSNSEVAAVLEEDSVIIETEALMGNLYADIEQQQAPEVALTSVSRYVNQLNNFWHEAAGLGDFSLGVDGIGPGSESTPFAQAAYLSSLLLTLHHPPDLLGSTNAASSRALTMTSVTALQLPQVLLDWLNTYCFSLNEVLEDVRTAEPNATADERFWEVCQCLVLRGRLQDVTHLLQETDFRYAVSAMDDGASQAGYKGPQLQALQAAITRAVPLLRSCPGLTQNDWQVDGHEWDLYRKQVIDELEYLASMAEAPADDSDDVSLGVFGNKPGSFLARSMGAKNKLPFSIFQQLRLMYSILLGGAEEIISQSQDWLEASLALTIWWDGSEDNNVAAWTMKVGRAQQDRAYSTEDLYLARLSAAFVCVTDPDDKSSFSIDTTSIFELGLASVLQGNVEGALGALKSLSLPIASAAAEIATIGGWFHATSSSSRGGGLNEEDLMVLSYGASSKPLSKDGVLLAYADALFEKDELQDKESEEPQEGWEISFALTARFSDRELASKTTSDYLENLYLISEARMSKVAAICASLGLVVEGQKVSVRYGDHLIANTNKYGAALVSYARGHAAQKIKQVVDLLISYTLVQSAAYPPESELDYQMALLVQNPKAALNPLAEFDSEAAAYLQFYMSGYACLRRFYVLRDEGVITQKEKRKPSMNIVARRVACTRALIAVINSAADSIFGGLYDADRDSAIQVDGLLALLGEATCFIGQPSGIVSFNSDQLYDLLAAIEDLFTVSERVFTAAEECLQASLRNYHGSLPPSPRAMLKKSVSSGTNSNFSFSMMGSEMLRSGESHVMRSTEDSGVLVSGNNGDRGWDWRSEFAKHEDFTGRQLLMLLRKGIGKDLAIAVLNDD